MTKPRKQPETKNCQQCGKTMIQPRRASGKLDSTFHKRMFCGRQCYHASMRASSPPTDNAGRRRAQKMFAAIECQRCGSTAKLQRHHKDKNPRNNSAMNVEIVCQSCHVIAENESGGWGKGKTLVEKPCVICGTVFIPTKNQDKLCKTPECKSRMGQQSAESRWAGRQKTKVCRYCGKDFRYVRQRQTTCSRSCGNMLAWQNRGEHESRNVSSESVPQ